MNHLKRMHIINMKKKDTLLILTIFATLLSSGANILIRNILFFLICVLIVLLKYKKINEKALLIGAIVIGYVWFDSCIVNTCPTDYHECVLMTLRIAGCAVIASAYEIEDLRKYFLRIVLVLSAWSLICFTIYSIFGHLPGQTQISAWVGTFYHTVGHSLRDNRNCGIFAEAGLYQMYINLALLSLIAEKEMPLYKIKKYFYLLSITLITTTSGMGYLIYLLVLIIIFLERREILPKFVSMGKKTRILIVIGIFIFVTIEELQFGFITNFVIQKRSWASRHDDNLISFLIANKYPIFGIGIATDPSSIWDEFYYKYASLRLYTGYQNAMSSGLGNFVAMGGYIFTGWYMFNIIKYFNRQCLIKFKLSKIIMGIILVMIALDEPYLSTPFFLMAIYNGVFKRKAAIKSMKTEQIKLRE